MRKLFLAALLSIAAFSSALQPTFMFVAIPVLMARMLLRITVQAPTQHVMTTGQPEGISILTQED